MSSKSNQSSGFARLASLKVRRLFLRAQFDYPTRTWSLPALNDPLSLVSDLQQWYQFNRGFESRPVLKIFRPFRGRQLKRQACPGTALFVRRAVVVANSKTNQNKK